MGKVVRGHPNGQIKDPDPHNTRARMSARASSQPKTPFPCPEAEGPPSQESPRPLRQPTSSNSRGNPTLVTRNGFPVNRPPQPLPQPAFVLPRQLPPGHTFEFPVDDGAIAQVFMLPNAQDPPALNSCSPSEVFPVSAAVSKMTYVPSPSLTTGTEPWQNVSIKMAYPSRSLLSALMRVPPFGA